MDKLTPNPSSPLSGARRSSLLADVAAEFDIAHAVAREMDSMPMAQSSTNPQRPNIAGLTDLTQRVTHALEQHSNQVLSMAANRVTLEQVRYQQAVAEHWAQQSQASQNKQNAQPRQGSDDVLDVAAREVRVPGDSTVPDRS